MNFQTLDFFASRLYRLSHGFVSDVTRLCITTCAIRGLEIGSIWKARDQRGLVASMASGHRKAELFGKLQRLRGFLRQKVRVFEREILPLSSPELASWFLTPATLLAPSSSSFFSTSASASSCSKMIKSFFYTYAGAKFSKPVLRALSPASPPLPQRPCSASAWSAWRPRIWRQGGRDGSDGRGGEGTGWGGERKFIVRWFPLK